MATITIANEKGGVGKTTTAVNLAHGLALKKYRVLVIDLDKQCNATSTLFGKMLAKDDINIMDCLLGTEKMEDVILTTNIPNLDIAPGGEALGDADVNLHPLPSPKHRLKSCLKEKFLSKYDFVIIDTSPSRGLLTINALVAADHIIVPISCESYPLLGLKMFQDTLESVRKDTGAHCEILGYLISMHDVRERITKDAEEILGNSFGDKVFKTKIRINTKFRISPAHQKTIFQYESGLFTKGADDFRALSREVLKRTGH